MNGECGSNDVVIFAPRNCGASSPDLVLLSPHSESVVKIGESSPFNYGRATQVRAVSELL